MKRPSLALRVTLNSALMIVIIYLFMQTIAFFRDNIMFGVSDITALAPTLLNFMGLYVFPPTIIFSVILYVRARPLQRVQERLESGEILPAETIEKTRLRILGFSTLILILNFIGFAAGYVVLLVVTKRLSDLTRPQGWILLTNNLASGYCYACAQTALDNKAFLPLRNLLGFREIGNRKRERRSTLQQGILAGVLAIFCVVYVQFNLRDVVTFQNLEKDILKQVASGTIPADSLEQAYRTAFKERLYTFSSREGLDFDSVPLPWERKTADTQVEESVFLLCFFFLFCVAFFVVLTSSVGLRMQLDALKDRLREVLTGGKDLRKRLNLLSMDDIGEITELINGLLDQFQSIVRGIAASSENTDKGSARIEGVLEESERISKETSQAVLTFHQEIESQTAEARNLSRGLEAFKQAATSVEAAAETQNQFAAETSSAMEEMASNIASVESMTARSGILTEQLRIQGELGGQTSKETAMAISEIAEAAEKVQRVLKALDKIAADINLLAMNAAIEAAHAGDKGLGFAVVADEVRNLAGTAAQQTKSIKTYLKTMSDRVSLGVAKSESSAKALNELISGIKQSASISREISDAMKEQTAGTSSVAKNLEKVLEASRSIRQRTQEQVAQTENMAAALLASLASFSALEESSVAQAKGIRALEDAFERTRAEVRNNLEAVKALIGQVEGFTV
jgi:methyl-accepting chemotaxis protein